MSSTCSMPTDRRTVSVGHAGRRELLGVELGVRRRGVVDRQRLRVADVGQVAEQLQRLDERAAGLDAALDAERDQRAVAALQDALGDLVVLVDLEARVRDPLDAVVRLEPLARPPARSALWRSMRSGSVSMPCRNRNALNGESAAPVLRSSTVRARPM